MINVNYKMVMHVFLVIHYGLRTMDGRAAVSHRELIIEKFEVVNYCINFI